MRVYKLEETACDVCLDIFAEWGAGGGGGGKLNQMMLRCLFLRGCCVTCGMYSSLWLKLLCPSAF